MQGIADAFGEAGLAETLIVMDDDDTLTQMACYDGALPFACQYLGGSAWYNWQDSLVKNGIVSEYKAAETEGELLKIASLLLSINNMIFTDSDSLLKFTQGKLCLKKMPSCSGQLGNMLSEALICLRLHKVAQSVDGEGTVSDAPTDPFDAATCILVLVFLFVDIVQCDGLGRCRQSGQRRLKSTASRLPMKLKRLFRRRKSNPRTSFFSLAYGKSLFLICRCPACCSLSIGWFNPTSRSCCGWS